MPNTLNPRLKTIIYKYNNFPTVDVSLRWVIGLLAFAGRVVVAFMVHDKLKDAKIVLKIREIT